MKISILYHSVSGNTKTISQYVKEGIQKAGNIDVKIMSIDEVDEEYISESQAVIFGSPTYYATMSWQMKKWFDTSSKIDLSDKLGACFATANMLGGGSEIAQADMIHHMLVKGMLVYSAGASKGQPYTHVGVSCIRDGDDFQKERAVIWGERIGSKALELFDK